MTKIERLLKYTGNEQIKSLKNGGMFDSPIYIKWREKNPHLSETEAQMEFKQRLSLPIDDTEELDNLERDIALTNLLPDLDKMLEDMPEVSEEQRAATELRAEAKQEITESQNTQKKSTGGLSNNGAKALGIASQIGSEVINGVDLAVMGDKNFSASSQAIDTGVHGVSSALMKSGNPYAAAAAVALEGINFVTKAAGKNVQGYDVNINNSGYGNLGHMDSLAGRVWDSWTGATARKLRKRNLQAKMALAAADISEDVAYEQEARTNSVTNVLQLNQIALAGGIDSSLLGN